LNPAAGIHCGPPFGEIHYFLIVHEALNFKISWRRPGKDLDTFGLVKFFSLPGFIVILIFTGILTVLLTLRAQQMALKKNEDYLLLLAANLNHQIYQQFLLPTAFEKGGRITLSDPEQAGRLDMVVRNTIHGFHVEQLNQYDQEGVFSYSTANLPLGKKCADVPGVRKALAGENYFELPGYSTFWSIFWPGGAKRHWPTSPSAWRRSWFPIRARWWASSRLPRIFPET
jgi:hypothetical protein